MNKAKLWAITLGVCVLWVPAAAKDRKTVESQWAAMAAQIDGHPAEWPQEIQVLEKDYAVRYAFQNDAQNLYVLFVFEDPKFRSSVEATGLTMWINGEGKEKKLHGLRFYRKSVNADELIKTLEQDGQTLTEEQKKEFKATPQYMLWTCDMVNKKGQTVAHPGIPAGTYRMVRSQKTAVYEMVVPVGLLDDPAAPKKWDPAQPLKIGFEWGGMTEEMMKAQAASIGAQGVQAESGGGSLESSLGGGNEDGMNAPSASLTAMRRGPKKYGFWLDLRMAHNIR